jgi:hypothetical protein
LKQALVSDRAIKHGGVSGNTYKNDSLGFTNLFPAGWVVNDKTTQNKVIEAGHEFAYGDIAKFDQRSALLASEHIGFVANRQ